jgi:hypothetical protein
MNKEEKVMKQKTNQTKFYMDCSLKQMMTLLLGFCLVVTSLFAAPTQKASAWTSAIVGCYAKNAKLTTKGKYANASMKGNKLILSGWLYSGSLDGSTWKKTVETYSLTSKTEYYLDENTYHYDEKKRQLVYGKEMTKKQFQKCLKKYGSEYDAISVDGGRITIQSTNDTISDEDIDLNDTGSLRVYYKGSSAEGSALDISPEQYGTVSIQGNYLVIKGMITAVREEEGTDARIIRYKSKTYKFPLKKPATAKLKAKIKKLSSNKDLDTFYFRLNKKGQATGMFCDSDSLV